VLLRDVSSNGGGVSSKRVSRLASFRGGAKHDTRSLAARLYHVTALGSGSDIAGRFDSNINPSGSIQNVGFWLSLESLERDSLESEERRIGDRAATNDYFDNRLIG